MITTFRKMLRSLGVSGFEEAFEAARTENALHDHEKITEVVVQAAEARTSRNRALRKTLSEIKMRSAKNLMRENMHEHQ